MTRAAAEAPAPGGGGGGSLAPTTTALASPRRIASIASLSETPKVEQAATGAKARPVILPSIEICAAGVLWMFQITLAETERQGGLGASHFFCKRVKRRCFSLIRLSLPLAPSPSTASDSISISSPRYSLSS